MSLDDTHTLALARTVCMQPNRLDPINLFSGCKIYDQPITKKLSE